MATRKLLLAAFLLLLLPWATLAQAPIPAELPPVFPPDCSKDNPNACITWTPGQWQTFMGWLSTKADTSNGQMNNPTFAGGSMSGTDASGANVTPTGSTARTLANGLAGPFTLTGSGTSGQYDAQISVTGGGSQPGQGSLYLRGAQLNSLGYDGSTQFRVDQVVGATDALSTQGGVNGLGPTLKCESATDTNVPCNFYAQGAADYYFNNEKGLMLHLATPPGMVVNNPKISPGVSGSGIFLEAEGSDGNIDVGFIPQGNGAILISRPDSTIVGGNVRGSQAIDLQSSQLRSAATQVASGSNSILIGGGGATASGVRSVGVGCQGCVLNGSGSSGFSSSNLNAFQRKNWAGQGGIFFTHAGDTQSGVAIMGARSLAAAAARLTTDGLTANVTNCLFTAQGSSYSYDILMVAHDVTAPGASGGTWRNLVMVQRNTGTVVVTSGTPTTIGAAITVSITADATIPGCVNFTATPAAATGTDEIRFVARVTSSEGGS